MTLLPVKDQDPYRLEYVRRMTTNKEHILSILTGLRRQSGESQTDLADALGVRQPTVSSWERQLHEPPLWQLVEWAERYNHRIEVVPNDDAKGGRLQRLLVVAAALDDAQLDDLLALAENIGAVGPDISRAAVELLRTVAMSDSKSAKAS